MSLFKEFVEGVASGFASASSDRSAARSAGDVVAACCRQLGWSIDERPGADELSLHFNDPLIGIRKVLIGIGGQGTVVGFSVFSAVRIVADKIPASVLSYLLRRNHNLCVAWRIGVGNGGNAVFALNYCTLASGLDPAVFKMLCNTMVTEAHQFDAKMKHVGLLQ